MSYFADFTYDYDLVMGARLSLPPYITIKLDRKHEMTVFRKWTIGSIMTVIHEKI